jgi:DNA mismatch repair protein MutS
MQQNLPFSIDNNVTPMMKQYLDIKSQHKDAIVFYRMGDFYEMFFQDATIAAPILGIALTKRGQYQNQDIPMCGIPFHSSDAYIAKLIEAGYKIAICEQLESPEEAKKRSYKAVVRREVVRIITSGTITEDNLLKGSAANFLVAISSLRDELALAWTDISTGEFYTCKSSFLALSNDLSRISPKEILISDKLYSQDNIVNMLSDWRRIITIQANNLFDLKKAEHKIKNYYNVISSDAFGVYTPVELIACGAVLEYVELTQKTSEIKISHPRKLNHALFMSIDAATRNNLELNRSLSGERRGSLLALIDKTKTSSGSRLLAQYISAPLIDVDAINNRLNLVEFFITNSELSNGLTTLLAHIGDTERSIARFSFNRGGPRDLQIIKQSLQAADLILASFARFSGGVVEYLQSHLTNLANFDLLFMELNNALSDNLPALARDGGFIKQEYSPRHDQLNELKQNSEIQLQALRQRYIRETGISTLKINYNNVLGYFIDITPQHAGKMSDELFIHRQTLANSVRYTSSELRSLESEILNVNDNILKLEMTLYTQLVEMVLEKSELLSLFAHSIAVIDVATSLSLLAIENNYCRPVIDNSMEFSIEGGRHPIIEMVLKWQKQEFMPNDCQLFKQPLWLITGPNMAGKSTFLRQNALIAILAQIGSYVPARSAHFGVIDKVFSRVGAADDLARGRSTFMVEMVETANILNNATERSLIILDEIGRGTSTYDGVSIASACLEFIHNQLKSRALFATHYHELTTLSNQLESLVCYTMQITEWQNKVIFMHKIIPGVADKSYGIHVAELAGLPSLVTRRAAQILSSLEQNRSQITTLDVTSTMQRNNDNNPLVEFIKQIEVDSLSPREALDILYKIKSLSN